MASGRLFGLDMQLISGMIFQVIAILILFFLLSYILFDPVKKVLNERRERIAKEVTDAKANLDNAKIYKQEYEEKLKNIEKEAQTILGEARRNALMKENEIVEEAKKEAKRIIFYAKKDAELEKKKVQDEVKQQIIEVSVLMAEKLVSLSFDEEQQLTMIQDALKEMDEELWQST